ncbi:MAG: hypothetical protein WC205_08080 [Opitutaceae bacterium]
MLSWSGSPSGLYLSVGPGSPPVPLRAAEDVLSPVCHAPDGSPLRLLDSLAAEAEPLATLSPPPGLKRAILVLAPNPAAGDAYVGVWLDDSPEARPGNSITLHNLASMPVALGVGSEQAILRPGDHQVWRFSATERALMIQAAIPRGDGWERVVSTPQPVKDGFRILIILRDGRRADGRMDALDLVTLYDYERPVKTP